MKTKLELFLTVQTAAGESLDDKPKAAEARIDNLLKPLNLVAEDQRSFGQLYWSRRGKMLELRDQPLDVVPAVKPPKA